MLCMLVFIQWRIQKSFVGDVVEWPEATSRAECREGLSPPYGEGSGEWLPPPQKMFSILELKLASFGALWVLIFTFRLLV